MGIYKKFVGLPHGHQITLSWLLQLKAMKFWSREMLPALAEGTNQAWGVDQDIKRRRGFQFRDLLMTAGSATDLVEGHDSWWVP